MNQTILRSTITRRGMLYGSAAAAGSVILANCSGGSGGSDGSGSSDGGGPLEGKGSVTEPLPTPEKFAESPQLTKQVEAGELPPIEERLPQKPYVVPHKWIQQGKYGGTIRTMVAASDDGLALLWFYGSSPMRFLNDGLDVTGGLVQTWDQNSDASEWTFHFRKGLRWSDGEPFTVDDILFWWEDLVRNPDHEEVPPESCRSGKGTLATFEKVDDHTLRMTFDAPTPLTAERMATFPNGRTAPRWVVPRHFARQFHPKYNDEVDDDWAVPDGLFAKKVDFLRNPDCPTLNAWQPTQYHEGRQVVWERNPYCYVVTPEGDQLPYVDSIVWKVNPETKVGKVDVFQGKVDFQMGWHYDIGLPDVERIDANAKESDIQRLLIDGGSGSGSLLMCNLDHRDKKYRDLFNKPEFRQAMSHSLDRKRIQKSVYYKTGYPTTGTLSPKAMEYNVNDEGKKMFERWRDSYVEHDPDRASRLFDQAGAPKNEKGVRTFADGSELRLIFDFPADAGPVHQQKNNIAKENLEELGFTVTMNPVTPNSWLDSWDNGRLDIRADWEVGDGPNHLLYPQWIAATDQGRYVPLRGRWYSLRGTEAADRGINENNPWKSNPPRREPEDGSPIDRLQKTYDKTKTEPDEMKRVQLVWDMIKIHIEHGPFFIGTVANTPQVIIKKNSLHNVPRRENLAQGGLANPSIHPTPGVYDPECFYWENPEDH